MEFIEITISNYRGIRGPITVPLEPGLNVLHGPNEIGKSTILEAAWDCLTQRSAVGGKTRARMLPRDGGVPEVRVRFSHAGTTFDLSKTFNKGKGSTLLRVEGEGTSELKDAEAEERLRAELGVGQPNSQGNIADVGLWPIVWVDQGVSGQAPTTDLGDSGRASIDGRLAEVGGEVFAGRGAEDLFAAVEAERSRYYTRTGQPTGELKDAQVKHADAVEERDSLLVTLARHESNLDEHARLEASVQKIDAQLPQLRDAARRAEKAQAELDSLLAQAAAAAQEGKIAELEAAKAAALEVRRAELRTQSAALAKAAEAAREAHRLCGEELEQRSGGRQELADAQRAAVSSRKAGEEEVQRLEAAERVRQRQEEIGKLTAKLEQAREHEARRQEVRDGLDGNFVTQAELKELRSLAKARDTAVTRLEAASAHLELRAERAFDGQLGDEGFALDAGQRRADAASLLYDTLRACRSEAQGRHMAPLREELEKLVALVFPTGRVQLDDSLQGLHLDRGVVEGQHGFDDLSGGAREQVGVLVRLALARLMAGDSGLPVLLDDSLIATDENRFRAMQRALDAAAKDLQIVFVTCHWERLRGLGLAPDHRVDVGELVAAG